MPERNTDLFVLDIDAVAFPQQNLSNIKVSVPHGEVKGSLGPTLQNLFCRNAIAVKLPQDFDALFEGLSEFSS